MHLADRLVAIEAEVVESEGEGPAIAITGAADDHLGEDRAGADLVADRRRIRPAREIECRGTDVIHPSARG